VRPSDDSLDGSHGVQRIDRLLVSRGRSEHEHIVVLESDGCRSTPDRQETESTERDREDGDERVDGADDLLKRDAKLYQSLARKQRESLRLTVSDMMIDR
jgi:hypothetical protein